MTVGLFVPQNRLGRYAWPNQKLGVDS